MKSLKFGKTTYHRNGVMGEGFYCVEFIWNEGSRRNLALVALVALVFDKSCAVIMPGDTAQRWDAGYFEGSLRTYLKLIEGKNQA